MRELLDRLAWTRYRLVRASRLSPTVIYRIAARGARVKRIDGTTLDVLCTTLGVGPGDLLAHVPTRRHARREAR